MALHRSSLFVGVATAVPGVLLAVSLRAAEPTPASKVPDFHVTARLAGFEQPIEIRQSGLRRRVDVATDAVVQSYISDRSRGVFVVLTAAGRRRLALVFPAIQEAVESPLPTDVTGFSAAAAPTRIGASQVAGRPCGLFHYAGANSRKGVACITPDGVVLQITPDGRASPIYEVQTLDLAPQDPRWFAIPAEYQVSALPGLGGAAKSPGSGASLDGAGAHP